MGNNITKIPQSHKRERSLAPKHWMYIAIGLIVYDVMAVYFSYFFGLWLRYDFLFTGIETTYLRQYSTVIPYYAMALVAFLWVGRAYRTVWRFAGIHELVRYTAFSLTASLAFSIITYNLYGRMPMSYYLVGAASQLVLVVGMRFSYRFYNDVYRRWFPLVRSPKEGKHTMIIGAGDAGRMIIHELQQSDKTDLKACCLVDDNPNKWGRYIEGVPVVGGRDSIVASVAKYDIDQIYLCIPSAPRRVRKEILDICQQTDCELKSLPGLYQLFNEEVSVSRMKSVAVEDLLGRDPIQTNLEEVLDQLQGQTVLVTGGGGSIGSELCRQIAAHSPKQLIILDIYENTTYSVELELRESYPELNLHVLIGSVRDSRRINQIFEEYRPDVVYHAAAHKHVPLMEYSPSEAIKNNVIGTYKTAYAALMHGTKRFVLISTDKAVNPTNIMGASKRLCEMVIQSMDAISKSGSYELLPFVHAHQDKQIDGQLVPDPVDHMAPEWAEARLDLTVESVKNEKRTGTQFVAVRFGNVLGSNGSVIPRFREQIAAGGPVTVTHPDITRFFMTIPEAVSLVLQAGSYAWGGEIFVLDMGESVKIDDLARNMIRLSGLKPDDDIKIVYTGLRPGEKLYEEKLMAEEGIKKTDNELIYIGKPVEFDVQTFLAQLEELAYASYENDAEIVAMVERIVTTFKPVGERP